MTGRTSNYVITPRTTARLTRPTATPVVLLLGHTPPWLPPPTFWSTAGTVSTNAFFILHGHGDSACYSRPPCPTLEIRSRSFRIPNQAPSVPCPQKNLLVRLPTINRQVCMSIGSVRLPCADKSYSCLAGQHFNYSPSISSALCAASISSIDSLPSSQHLVSNGIPLPRIIPPHLVGRSVSPLEFSCLPTFQQQGQEHCCPLTIISLPSLSLPGSLQPSAYRY